MEENNALPTDTQTQNHEVLSNGWKVILLDKKRFFYVNELKKICSWLPPVEAWRSCRGLPFGWELAQDSNSKQYYISHLTKETYRDLPSPSELPSSSEISPRIRKVVISRHSDIGYGFVAGSEKPVLIRSVAEDGPSAGKLYANDQILKINDEAVGDMPQADVILRIKQSAEELSLEVIASDDVQDVRNQGQRKSSIMSRKTREKRRSNPVSVRFAETPVLVQYVCTPPTSPLKRSCLPLIPNVLKIFLENGQTRSFSYTSTTVVKDIFVSLADKIGLKKCDRFALVLQATQTLNNSIVQSNERVSQIYTKRNCSSSAWLSKVLLVFAPKDIHLLLKEDPIAFDYFYRQMCSQVVEGRFGFELRYETAIKLAALQLQQYALEEKIGKGGKISVKAIEREVGSLENFVPSAIANTMQKKDLQRVLTQQIKQTRNLCPAGQKYISSLQAKLQYLKICSEMKTYGGKQFNAVVVDPITEDQKFFHDQKLNCVIFVGPNVGLAQVTNPRSFSLHQVAEFNQLSGLVITPHTEGKQHVKLFLNNGKSVTLIMGPMFETRDFVYLLSGYHKLLVENARPLSIIDVASNVEEPVNEVPPYSDPHRVLVDVWSYDSTEEGQDDELREIDFKRKPKFEESEQYSMADHRQDAQPSSHICNGEAKFALSSSQSLNSIEEEPSSPKSLGGESDAREVPDLENYASGGRDINRKSVVHLNDPDLSTASTDDKLGDDAESNSNPDGCDKRSGGKAKHDAPVMSVTMQLSNENAIFSRNYSSIHVTSPSHTSTVSSNMEIVSNGEISHDVYEVEVDIPFSSSVGSSDANNCNVSSTEIRSTSRPADSTPKTSVTISSALILRNSNMKKDAVYSSSESESNEGSNSDSSTERTLTTESEENINKNEDRNMMNGVEDDTQKIPNDESHDSETIQSYGNKIDVKMDVLIEDNEDESNSCRLSGIVENCDTGNLTVNRRRRRSSGYISHRSVNGDLHPNTYTPECVICDDITLEVGQATEDVSHNICLNILSSRSAACDDAIKTFYGLKTKLNTLLHSNNSVRTSNDILRAKRVFMLEKIEVLQECAKQIQDLQSSEVPRVLKAILTTRSCLSQLTDSCISLYNAQYSMRHFTVELIESIARYIDVLITTDAWNSTSPSSLTLELHKDKCDLVHDSLKSLQKIVNGL